jgi:hypothetical protein
LAKNKGVSPKNKARIIFKKGGAGNKKEPENRIIPVAQNS